MKTHKKYFNTQLMPWSHPCHQLSCAQLKFCKILRNLKREKG